MGANAPPAELIADRRRADLVAAPAISATTEDMVRKWLDELVDGWLMFREGAPYLTLAVRKRRGHVSHNAIS